VTSDERCVGLVVAMSRALDPRGIGLDWGISPSYTDRAASDPALAVSPQS